MHEVELYPQTSEAAVGAAASSRTPHWQKRSPIQGYTKPAGNTTNACSVRVPVEPDGIPDYLKVRPQWVNWRFEQRGKKWTKVPYTPGTRRRASSTDLLTWRTFEEALGSLDDFDGVGFVFCSGDPYCALDFDNCRVPTLGKVAPRVLEYIERFEDAYVEVSPSGTGIHLITRGKIRGGAKRGKYELYDQDRYFCVTGVRL